MKHIKTLLFTALCCSTWACTSEEDTMMNPSEETENTQEGLPAGWVTCKGKMNTTVSDYTEAGATTRANGAITNTWADGTKIYLVIESGKVKVPVVAVYSNTFAEWSFSYDPTQSIPSTGTMVAHYFKDATTADFTGATLNENSIVYTDSVAQYSYDNGTFIVGIHMTPAYFRIRLAGVPSQQVTLSGLNRVTNYIVNTGVMEQEYFKTSLTASSTAEDGRYYTPYVYGNFGENDSVYAELEDENRFCRSLKDAAVTIGKSVWTSMPSANYIPKGWKKASWIYAVDLGLSVRWATCNVGATKPEEYGGYYAWGETEEKEDYSWATYKWYNNHITKYFGPTVYDDDNNVADDYLDLEDDVAHIEWGGVWRMPTRAEIQELCERCTWTWTAQKGITGYTVSASNGNSIFLPAAGYRNGTSYYNKNSEGYYWSNQINDLLPSMDNCSFHVQFYKNYYTYYSEEFRYLGFTVRPVTDELLSGSEK